MSRTHQSQESPAIDVCHIKDFEAFGSLRDAWNLLLPKNPVQDAFLTREWLFAWWKHYGKPRELWLVAAWISDDLVGVAPLMLEERRKYGLRLRVLCSLGTPDVDVGGFIVRDGDPHIYAALFDHLIAQKELWDILELNEFMLDGPEIEQFIPCFRNAGFAKHQKTTVISTFQSKATGKVTWGGSLKICAVTCEEKCVGLRDKASSPTSIIPGGK